MRKKASYADLLTPETLKTFVMAKTTHWIPFEQSIILEQFTWKAPIKAAHYLIVILIWIGFHDHFDYSFRYGLEGFQE